MCNLNVKDVINSMLADDADKGELLFREITSPKYKGQTEFILDFNGIELVNTAFLNNAVGKLYNPKEFDLNKISVKIVNMGENMLDLLRESIRSAMLMYN